MYARRTRQITVAILLVVLAAAGQAAAQTAAELIAQGEAAASQGDYQKATTLYTQALQVDPSRVDVRFKRGVARARARNFADAIADFDVYLMSQPQDSVALGNRCYAKIETGVLDAAMADCNAALAIDPKAAGVYVNRGRIHSRRNDLDAAIADYTTAIGLDPADQMAYNNRGAVRRRAGDLQGALADYRKALEIKPDYALAKRNLDTLMQQMAGSGAPPPLPGGPPADVDSGPPPLPPGPPPLPGGPPPLPAGPPPMPGGPPPLPGASGSPTVRAPAPAAGTAGQAVEPVRVGGAILEPKRIKHVEAVYPEVALQARVEGVVIVECVIQPEGTVGATKVIRSVPLLDEAAVAAVKQWTYEPTMLNGVPVPVVMTVTVSFALK